MAEATKFKDTRSQNYSTKKKTLFSFYPLLSHPSLNKIVPAYRSPFRAAVFYYLSSKFATQYDRNTEKSKGSQNATRYLDG